MVADRGLVGVAEQVACVQNAGIVKAVIEVPQHQVVFLAERLIDATSVFDEILAAGTEELVRAVVSANRWEILQPVQRRFVIVIWIDRGRKGAASRCARIWNQCIRIQNWTGAAGK